MLILLIPDNFVENGVSCWYGIWFSEWESLRLLPATNCYKTTDHWEKWIRRTHILFRKSVYIFIVSSGETIASIIYGRTLRQCVQSILTVPTSLGIKCLWEGMCDVNLYFNRMYVQSDRVANVRSHPISDIPTKRAALSKRLGYSLISMGFPYNKLLTANYYGVFEYN